MGAPRKVVWREERRKGAWELMAVRTWAPCSQSPILHVKLTHDHLSRSVAPHHSNNPGSAKRRRTAGGCRRHRPLPGFGCPQPPSFFCPPRLRRTGREEQLLPGTLLLSLLANARSRGPRKAVGSRAVHQTRPRRAWYRRSSCLCSRRSSG